MIGTKLLHVRFDQIDGFIRVYNGTRYLELFGPQKYDAIYNRIRYLVNQNSGTTHINCRNYARIKIDSYDSLSLEETLTLYNIIILKCSYQLPKNNENKYLYISYKFCIMIELTFLKELILIRQGNQKRVIFITIIIF